MSKDRRTTQRYTLGFYLMALVTAERAFDDEAAAIFREAVDAAREYASNGGRLSAASRRLATTTAGCCGRLQAVRVDVRDSLSLAALLLDRPDLAPWNVRREAVWMPGR